MKCRTSRLNLISRSILQLAGLPEALCKRLGDRFCGVIVLNVTTHCDGSGVDVAPCLVGCGVGRGPNLLEGLPRSRSRRVLRRFVRQMWRHLVSEPQGRPLQLLRLGDQERAQPLRRVRPALHDGASTPIAAGTLATMRHSQFRAAANALCRRSLHDPRAVRSLRRPALPTGATVGRDGD